MNATDLVNEGVRVLKEAERIAYSSLTSLEKATVLAEVGRGYAELAWALGDRDTEQKKAPRIPTRG